MRLCEATLGSLQSTRGGRFRTTATRGVPGGLSIWRRNPPDYGPGTQPVTLAGEHIIHVPRPHQPKTSTDPGDPDRQGISRPRRRAQLIDGAVLATIRYSGSSTSTREEARPFSGKQIALLDCGPGGHCDRTMPGCWTRSASARPSCASPSTTWPMAWRCSIEDLRPRRVEPAISSAFADLQPHALLAERPQAMPTSLRISRRARRASALWATSTQNSVSRLEAHRIRSCASDAHSPNGQRHRGAAQRGAGRRLCPHLQRHHRAQTVRTRMRARRRDTAERAFAT